MKKTKSGRKKRSVTCKRITGPYLCRMIAEKGPPSLSTGAFWMDLLQILPNSPFTHMKLQLEQFPTDALCSPESVVGCHLLHQGNRRGAKTLVFLRPLSFCASRTGGRAHDGSRRSVSGWTRKRACFARSDHPGEEYQKKPIRLSVGWPLDLAMQDDQWLSQERIFCQ